VRRIGVRAVVRLAPGAAVLLALGSSAGPAAAQPLAWSVQARAVVFPPSNVNQLAVFNLATGVEEVRFTIPAGVTAGDGVRTPDGRYFLLPTNVGIGRFVTSPPSSTVCWPPAWRSRSCD
jgi:hypothetical protein